MIQFKIGINLTIIFKEDEFLFELFQELAESRSIKFQESSFQSMQFQSDANIQNIPQIIQGRDLGKSPGAGCRSQDPPVPGPSTIP